MDSPPPGPEQQQEQECTLRLIKPEEIRNVPDNPYFTAELKLKLVERTTAATGSDREVWTNNAAIPVSTQEACRLLEAAYGDTKEDGQCQISKAVAATKAFYTNNGQCQQRYPTKRYSAVELSAVTGGSS